MCLALSHVCLAYATRHSRWRFGGGVQAMQAVEGPLVDTVRATYRAEAARVARQAASSDTSNHRGGHSVCQRRSEANSAISAVRVCCMLVRHNWKQISSCLQCLGSMARRCYRSWHCVLAA